MEESSWRDLMRHAYRQGKSARDVDALGLEVEASPPESTFELLKRAAMNRYLTYAMVKELSFRMGRALG
jgi:hypothetical protein